LYNFTPRKSNIFENGITLIAESGEISYQPIIIEDGDCPTCAPVKCLGVNITKITNN